MSTVTRTISANQMASTSACRPLGKEVSAPSSAPMNLSSLAMIVESGEVTLLTLLSPVVLLAILILGAVRSVTESFEMLVKQQWNH